MSMAEIFVGRCIKRFFLILKLAYFIFNMKINHPPIKFQTNSSFYVLLYIFILYLSCENSGNNAALLVIKIIS